jgi:hypothetical protein
LPKFEAKDFLWDPYESLWSQDGCEGHAPDIGDPRPLFIAFFVKSTPRRFAIRSLTYVGRKKSLAEFHRIARNFLEGRQDFGAHCHGKGAFDADAQG